jgi:hypothetical protein
VADIEQRLRVGAVIRVAIVGDEDALEAAAGHFAAEPDVVSVERLDGPVIELGFRGDDHAAAGLLGRAVAAGIAVASFARAASDLEELFLQVTARDRSAGEAA